MNLISITKKTSVNLFVSVVAMMSMVVAALPAAVSADTSATPGVLVSDRAQACTPNIKTGYIGHKALVVGTDTVIIGGQFSQWENCTRTTTYNRSNVVAYSATNGAVTNFVADANSDVYALEKTPDNQSVYIGGNFTTINGVAKRSIAKVDAVTGAVDPNFIASLPGTVRDLQYCGGKLYVGGGFTKRLTTLDPNTGADLGDMNFAVSGTLANNGSAGTTRVDKISINPACSDLIAIGNFTTINGQSRNSAFRVTISGPATLTSWHPQRFDAVCPIPYYLRNVEWSADGQYFVIVSTGGPVGYPATGFCDGAGRWEASSTGNVASPTWINWTGGDSLYSQAIDTTAHVVYVGGHNRWLDNPDGHDSAGTNAYPVDSIGAINTDTGLAVRTWDARPMTRGHGKEDLLLWSGGLVTASDGIKVSGAYHAGTAIFRRP